MVTLSSHTRQPTYHSVKVEPLLVPPTKPRQTTRDTRFQFPIRPAVSPLIAFDALAFQQWMALNYTYNDQDTVLVVVTQPNDVSVKALEATVRDALSSPHVHVLIDTYTSVDARHIQTVLASDLAAHRVQVTTRTVSSRVVYPNLHDDMNTAHLLELASQLAYNFTLVLRGGMRLVNASTAVAPSYYSTRAVAHYRFLQAVRKGTNNVNRTCFTLLSQEVNPIAGPTLGALFLETKEHVARLSMLLRSTLPYYSKQTTEIVDYYCRRILWEAKEAMGPVLFHNTQPDSSVDPLPFVPDFVNASDFAVPDWIHATVPVGPVVYDQRPPFTVAFGVTTMTRPVKGNEYLVQFMKELLQIVENDFTSDTKAIIVLLVSGNTVTDVATHHAFLEQTYQSAIVRGLVQLVDAPVASYAPQLQQLRLTFPLERPERRYWRSKQNLDIAATLRATAGLSSYIMLLEDDTGFQPGFAASLKATMQGNNVRPHGIPSWGVAEYGFGYSGVLIHASDVHVFSAVHETFYDERPCDLYKIDKLVRNGRVLQVISRKRFANRKMSYLKHNGQVSSLEGKVQVVW